MNKILSTIYIGLFIFTNDIMLGQVKICEIIYGENDLEKKELKINLMRNMKNKPPVECTKIGLEYNKNKKPQINKPIYSCCHLDRRRH